ncbi:MAG: oligosaccharide flippase family protein [Desulfobacterales bacterium]|nr:oligosaccharide flippase family protein [Desulfobacterales bacterium]
MSSKGGRLIKGSTLQVTGFVIKLGISFIMMPLIIHSLGDRHYGAWVLVGTFIGYYGLLDLGLSSAVTRYVSRALSRNDHQEINLVASSAFFLFSGFSLVALALSLVAAALWPIFAGSTPDTLLFQQLLVILGISAAAGLPIRTFRGVLNALVRYDLTAIANVVRLFLTNIVLYVLLKMGYGLLTMAVLSLLGGLIEYGLLVIFCFRACPGLAITRAGLRRDRIRQLFAYGGKTFISEIADILRFRVDSMIIAGSLGLSLVTYYQVGARLVQLFSEFILSGMNITAPIFSHYEGKNDFDSIRSKFLDISRLNIIISLFVGISIPFYGKVFIDRWMGPGFEQSFTVALILCGPAILEIMQHTTVTLLYGISKHHYYTLQNIGEGIANLVLSLILVRYYGIIGVAMGTAIEMLFFKLLVQPVLACRTIALPLSEYYIKTMLFTSLKTLVPLLAYLFFIHGYLRPDYLNMALFGILQVVLFTPVAYFFILNAGDRRMLQKALAGVRDNKTARTGR